jgi:ribonuclease HII
MPHFRHERLCEGPVAGIDEAGRGPLAGPVVAAAVIVHAKRCPRACRGLIDDSKQLEPEDRERAFIALLAAAAAGELAFGVAAASVREIDRINILQATFLAMRRALARLPAPPARVLIDGDRVPPGLGCDATTLVGGDGSAFSIAAASILAKVTRDRAMSRLAPRYPAFHWHTNMGYSTDEHLQGIDAVGVTRHHRLSFAPCAQGRLDFQASD